MVRRSALPALAPPPRPVPAGAGPVACSMPLGFSLGRRFTPLRVATSAFSSATTPLRAAFSATTAFKATVDYVVQFYPLWFTFRQAHNFNQLIGPDRISPLYHAVVAINVDTLYASAFVDLKAQPVILTIPSTNVTYSLLTLDPYGDIIDISNYIPPQTAGTYALAGPGFKGSL